MKCEGCGATLSEGANFCRYCGKATKQKQRYKCNSCGSLQADGAWEKDKGAIIPFKSDIEKEEEKGIGGEVGSVNDVIARLSAASDEEQVKLAMELLKNPNYMVRASVASEVARLEIRAVGVWFELANMLADGHEEARTESAKAFWKLKGVDYAIRSLRDEYENPAHISKEDALVGITALRETADDETAFEKLLEENWEDCPRIKKKPTEQPIEKQREATDEPNVDRLEEKKDDNITCASCKNKFTWNEVYYQQNTPDSAPYHPPGHGDYRPRVFCPHCGALVVDWYTTRVKDFDEWIWFGDNATLNAECTLPPYPILGGWGQGIPIDFKPSYAEHKIDIKKIKQFNVEYEARRRKAIEKVTESKEEEDINWDDIENYYYFGHSLEKEGDYKGAETAYRLSIEIDPKFMAAYNGLGLLLKSQKRYDEAIETFRKAMEVDQYNGLAYLNLASLLIYLKRFEDAEEVYKKAMKIVPTNPITEYIKRKLLER